ncbi:uncharacterized protein N7473_002185 [Penicillium subrubescens]|uniref:WSC domain-containing protein n=1 Tax=Penicillium subrubescens TaxID=1316194 RepID=A0A1Q5SX89_9EURO|nr:uncharacterized protein N7473_002185 [Penicillium subrubescens]KAJ5905269.1 hypothetical protein N7473_002185 [Penicillium subrubescens]OKO92639.1 hypothetical protein PENSUB_12624 [Penicillium subrubescens]
MFFSLRTALMASSILLAAGSVTAQSMEELVPRSAMTLVGCYSSSEGLTNQTSYTFQSSGWCYDRCIAWNAAVFALTAGSDCLCGDELPPSSAKVAKGKCGTACDGWPSDMCGGDGFYSLYTTGLESSVSSASASTSSSGTNESAASKTDSGAASVSTDSGGQTVVVTAPSVQHTTDSSSQVKSSHNTAAIAAGVVVGVVGVAALAGAAFFFYRSKKQNAEGGFRGTTGGYGRDSQPPSMSDSRFDGDYMAQRRQSNGSIDDDHDFSRRILQVTNPDRR